jgi:hypothetical protein
MNQIQITTFDKINEIGLRGCYKHFKYREPLLYEQIEACHGSRFVERLYNFVYGYRADRKCEECHINSVSFKSFAKGYAFFCGPKCVANNRAHQKKKRDTSQEKYNCDKPSQNSKVDKKRRDTLIKRYGTDSLAKIRWLKNKK